VGFVAPYATEAMMEDLGLAVLAPTRSVIMAFGQAIKSRVFPREHKYTCSRAKINTIIESYTTTCIDR
jgi:hypothetical protein